MVDLIFIKRSACSTGYDGFFSVLLEFSKSVNVAGQKKRHVFPLNQSGKFLASALPFFRWHMSGDDDISRCRIQLLAKKVQFIRAEPVRPSSFRTDGANGDDFDKRKLECEVKGLRSDNLFEIIQGSRSVRQRAFMIADRDEQRDARHATFHFIFKKSQLRFGTGKYGVSSVQNQKRFGIAAYILHSRPRSIPQLP